MREAASGTAVCSCSGRGLGSAELAVHAPAVLEACKRAWAARIRDLGFIIPGRDFLDSPDISIDYAVMEHTDQAVVTPLHLTWNDLGSWEAFYEIAPKDEAGNVLEGDVLAEESSGCYLRSDSRLIAALDVHDLAVVETRDAILVSSLTRTQEVRRIVKARATRAGRKARIICAYSVPGEVTKGWSRRNAFR